MKNAVFLLFSFGLISCVSLNVHQTGRTLGKCSNTLVAKIGYGYIYAENYDVSLDSKAFLINDVGLNYMANEYCHKT